MNRRRLLKMVGLLRADAKNKGGIRFDFGTWGDIGDEKKPMSCGTRACALGLAAISGAFKRAGLGFKASCRTIDFTLHGKQVYALTAAAKVFDISESDADYLFASGSDLNYIVGAKSEREVAKRIRKFVTSGGKTPHD